MISLKFFSRTMGSHAMPHQARSNIGFAQSHRHHAFTIDVEKQSYNNSFCSVFGVCVCVCSMRFVRCHSLPYIFIGIALFFIFLLLHTLIQQDANVHRQEGIIWHAIPNGTYHVNKIVFALHCCWAFLLRQTLPDPVPNAECKPYDYLCTFLEG